MTASTIDVKHEVLNYESGSVKNLEVSVVREKPLTVFLNHLELATMVCSPGGLTELAVGFLINEGLIQKPDDIISISLQEEEGLVWIETSSPVPQAGNFLRRHIASCCGKSRAGLYFINDARQVKAVESLYQFSVEYLLDQIALLEDKSATFKLTGGVHSAALGSAAGFISMYEDIGRHNAVDKVLGHAFLNHIPTDDKFLLLSGRIASEILIKAARSNVPLVLSRSAPTDLTLDLADELNICVVGFARGQRLNIYSHPEKVIISQQA